MRDLINLFHKIMLKNSKGFTLISKVFNYYFGINFQQDFVNYYLLPDNILFTC